MKTIASFVIFLLVCVMAAGAFADAQAVNWSSHFRIPSDREVKAHTATGRAPYLVCYPQFGNSQGFTDYAVDFRADHLPIGTYVATCNFDIDYSVLLKSYASVSRDYQSVGGYCGFQRGYDGKGLAIMTIWDTTCRAKNGNTTVLRASGVYPKDSASFQRNKDYREGSFLQCIVPFDWKEGRNYRTVVQLYGRKVTFFVEDLLTQAWTMLMEFDIGYEGGFITSPCAFLEDFSLDAQGAVRSMALANFRARDCKTGKWISTKKAILGENYEYPGSYNYGTEGNAFFFITSNIPGLCKTPAQYATFTVSACDSGAPY